MVCSMPRLILSVLFIAGTLGASQAQSPIKHIALIALENHEYSQMIGNPNMPYFNSLVSKGALATKFYATTHPSLPNYFRVTTGQHITDTNSYSGTVTADNIVRVLTQKGLTWKAYSENLPYAGYLGSGDGLYVRKHNPFAFFSDVKYSSTQVKRLVPYGQLATDLANNAIPSFMYIQPNQRHNGHDCPSGGTSCSETDKMVAMDNWLLSHIPNLLNDPEFKQNGLLVIWFDEGTTDAYGGGRIPVIFVGPYVATGAKPTTFYDHDNLLHTIGKLLGFPRYPGASADATTMTAMLKPSAFSSTSYGVTVSSPLSGSSVSSPVKASATAKVSGTIYRFELWVDGVKKASTSNSTSLNASVSLPAGSHRFTFRARNTSGTHWDKVVYATVK
jgi:phosphatidylinositol-3-phosphatase